MNASELMAVLIAADPRRDYYLRHMMSNVFDAGGRLALADKFHLLITPGFSGTPKYRMDCASWAEIAEGATAYLKIHIAESL